MAQLSVPGGNSITSVDFGGVRVNVTRQLTVRLTNVGGAPLVITERPTLEANTPAFTYVGPESLTLEPGASADFQVSFKPSARQAYSDTLRIPSNSVNSPTRLGLRGMGAEPELKLDRSALSFGDVRVGTQSEPLPVTVNNTGTGEALLQSLLVEGPFEVVLPQGSRLPAVVPPQSAFTFHVLFKPSAEGKAAGSVSLLTDTASEPLTAQLAGTGTVARLASSVASLDFGAQRVRQSSGPQLVILSNTGSAALVISQLVFSTPVFGLSRDHALELPLAIAPGEQRAIALTFTPSMVGLVEGKLFIISNAFTPAPPLALKGMGSDGQLSLTPSAVSFGAVEVQSQARQVVVLTNTGTHPLTLHRVEAPMEAAFSVSGITPGLVLEPGQQWPFTLTFSPAKRGHLASTLVIESDASTNPTFNLAVSGTGVAPVVEVVPSELHFGRANVGGTTTQNLSIQNVGERALYVSNIAFEDATAGSGAALDFQADGTFPLMLEPGRSSLIPLKFTPRGMGLRQASAVLYTNDRTARVGLHGEGTSPKLEASAATLEFGHVLMGSVSEPLVLRLVNTGSGPLTLTQLALAGADASAFTLVAATLPLTLQPQAVTEIAVAFKPDAERRFSAQLVVGSNDSDVPGLTVPLAGTGVRQQLLQLSPSPLRFGRQLIHGTSSPRKVRVTNHSNTPVTLSALTVEGAGASRFTVGTLPLPTSLAPGRELEVAVTFAPVSEAEVDCTLKLAFRELPQPLEVALQGQGISTLLAVSPSPLDFGTVRAASGKHERPLTVTNLSSETLFLAKPEFTYTSGERFFLVSDTVDGRMLEPGASVVVMVAYQPTAETLSEATLSFGTTSPPKPRSVEVPLKGRATKRFLVADPSSLNFGRVELGAAAVVKEVTLINRSSQPQWATVKQKRAGGSPFSVTDTKVLVEPIPPGASVTFKVSFQPQTEGTALDEVQVWVQGQTEADVLIPVSGVGFSQDTGEPGGVSCGSTGVGSPVLWVLLTLVGLCLRPRKHG